MAQTATLPRGFSLRAPTMDDLEAVTDLVIACDIAEYGKPDYTTDDLLAEWEKLRFNLATDAWVVVTPQGQIVGYAETWDRVAHVRIGAVVYVHPEYWNHGIGTFLLRSTEARARQHIPEAPSDARVTVEQTVSRENEAVRQLLEGDGYTPVKYDWRMEIEMGEAPPIPVWPEGITVRTFVPGQDERAAHALIQEAFGELPRYVYFPLEEWVQLMTKREDFDPTVWYLAMNGNELVGTALCYDYQDMGGWVRQLAVQRSWRGRGLALALLHQAFGEFYRRGKRIVGLGVDANNPTGATRLYERAGMHVAMRFVTYEKELRPGK